MATKPTLIPTEPIPQRSWGLTDAEKMTLNAMVLFGEKNLIGNFLIGHCTTGERSMTDAKIKQRARELLSLSEAKDYMTEYRNTIEGRTSKVIKAEPILESEIEDVKVFYKQRLDRMAGQAISVVESLLLDPEQQSTAIQAFIRLQKQYDTDDSVAEYPAIRYLPEMCGKCRYKLYVVDNVDDFCSMCKYKSHCNEQGIEYAEGEMLEEKDV